MLVVYHGEPGPRQRSRFADVERSTGVTIAVCAQGDVSGMEALLGDVEVWWHVLRPITADHLERAPKLRLVQKWGVGVNTIDVAAAAARGVAVANMAGSNAVAVSEHTLLLILATLRRLTTFHAATATGRGWAVDPSVGEGCGELAGRTLGLVGFGDVAQRVARTATAMGAHVLHHSLRDDRPGWRSLDALLDESDVVSLHVPLTDATAAMIGPPELARMRPGSVLVNTARGGLVDLDALAEAIEHGTLLGAGLDVFIDEPNDATHRVFALDTVVTTPHVAWLTWETLERSLALAVDNVERLRDGRPLAGLVTPNP